MISLKSYNTLYISIQHLRLKKGEDEEEEEEEEERKKEWNDLKINSHFILNEKLGEGSEECLGAESLIQVPNEKVIVNT